MSQLKPAHQQQAPNLIIANPHPVRQEIDLVPQATSLCIEVCDLIPNLLGYRSGELLEIGSADRAEPVKFVVRNIVKIIQQADDFKDLGLEALEEASKAPGFRFVLEVEATPSLPRDEALRIIRDLSK